MKNIRKSIFIAFLALCTLSFTSSNLNAQSFEKGDLDLNIQLGFGSSWYYSYNTNAKIGLPFISVGAEYALVDTWGPGVFGVGVITGFSTIKYYSNYTNTNFTFLPRASYHYQFVDKLDTYAGVGAGIEIRAYSNYYSTDVNAIVTAFAGVKYYFTRNFCVMSEIYVYKPALFNIGVGFKF